MEKLHWKEELIKLVMEGRTDYETLIKYITGKHHKYSLRGGSLTESEGIVRRYLLG